MSLLSVIREGEGSTMYKVSAKRMMGLSVPLMNYKHASIDANIIPCMTVFLDARGCIYYDYVSK